MDRFISNSQKLNLTSFYGKLSDRYKYKIKKLLSDQKVAL